ncbi:MAG: HAD family phosphatase [Candidatus Nanohaloarchaeota archaeon QJJ-7]|nr:HAD family phosphatase [Candidatus Nanohaloarchaeota archaeon QJJ-7]
MEAVVFDMDGVIVDSERYWHRLEREIFEEELEEDVEGVMEEVKGRNYRETYELLAERYGLDMDRTEFIGRYDEAAEVIYGERVELMEDFCELVPDLREEGFKTAVVSSSPRRWIGMVFDRFGLEELFDLVLSVEEIEGGGKPQPDVYIHAAEKLGVEPGSCVAVEDSFNGVRSAKEAGMFCIRFGGEGEIELADADALDAEDLRSKLKEFR